MSGFDLNTLDLNGNYVVDATKSDSLEEVMKLQGMGWAKRKIGAKFANTMGLNIVYNEEKMVQTYSAAVNTKIVEVSLKSPGEPYEFTDAELGAKLSITVTWEDDGKTLRIFSKCPSKKFERNVTWERIDDRTIHSTIQFTLTDGSKQQVTANRYYVKAN